MCGAEGWWMGFVSEGMAEDADEEMGRIVVRFGRVRLVVVQHVLDGQGMDI